MSRAASEATDRGSLSHASEASDRPNREKDVDEPQDPFAMTEPLSLTRAKQATDLTASKTSTNCRTRWQLPSFSLTRERSKRPTLPRARRRRIAGPVGNDRASLSHASEASYLPNREQDADEPQDPWQ